MARSLRLERHRRAGSSKAQDGAKNVWPLRVRVPLFFLEEDARALWRARKAEQRGGAGVGARIHKQQAWYGYGETHGLGRGV